MFKKEDILKNKKILIIVGVVLFLIGYYLLFAKGKVDMTFSAKDLKVRVIDNKKDFENKIVRNIYDKIVESCEPKYERNYYDDRPFDTFNGGGGGGGINVMSAGAPAALSNSESSSFDFATSISARISKSSSITNSISFDGNKPKPKTTKDVSFSQTNIQKQKVDEGDILKQTKDYIFYFSKQNSKIYIMNSPVNNSRIDLNNIEAIHIIEIPSNLTISPELFINEKRLVYLASKKAYNNNNTIVGIYDISNLKNREVSLYKIFETKGEYFKSRLIDNNLYLISDYSLKPFKNQFCNILNKDKSSGFGEFITFFTGIEFKSIGINKELFNELKEELESYSYKLNGYSGNPINQQLEDFKVFYTNKDLKESIENLNFNIISVVDINEKENKASQTLVFGNLKNGEIHMTLDNLYLVNSYFQDEKWKCDYIDICYKEFSSNNFTSISKLSYKGKDVDYLKTSIIPGKPINQYSMDEDEGYFRIFTAHGSRNRDAALYIFDKKLKLIGEIDKIKPGEEFKSSRFIGDKAFLVTFRQTDPLFVIDLHIPSTPKIIGELHIPGYSSYLHPYGTIGNKEYLIGIGQENRNVKVDLYEVDYEKLGLGGQIDVKQKYSYKFKGNSSQTPAETNPRTFVWDGDEKLLYLPIKISNSYQNQNFIGLKVLEIKHDLGITEKESNKVSYSSNIMDSRVGYYKAKDDKATFFVEGGFIKFFSKYAERRVDFK